MLKTEESGGSNRSMLEIQREIAKDSVQRFKSDSLRTAENEGKALKRK